jgi:3-hydroxyacyl-[acyl-carrier-protein] dehydratase
LQQLTFSISERAPFLAGHFPGNPVVPGVVLLDRLLEGMAAVYPDRHVLGLSQVKFHQPVFPGEQIRLELNATAASSVGFQAWRGDVVVFSGKLSCEAVK